MKKLLAFSLTTLLTSTPLIAAENVSDAESLRKAIQMANSDDSITEIIFNKNASISLEAPLIYTGNQSLTFVGNNATIDGSKAGSFALKEDLTAITKDATLMFNTAAPLTFTDLTIENSATRGLVVNIPDEAQGNAAAISLSNVTIKGSALYGLHIDDNADEFDDGQTGSAIGINLIVKDSTFINNGVGAIDFDGVRVDERGEGDIISLFTDTTIDANGGDGIELDEAGNGDIDVTMIDVSVSNNGFYNPTDLDDGFDADEADGGNINATLINVTVNNNLDEGLDFDEAGAGSVITKLHNVTAIASKDEGIKVDEEGAGNIIVSFSDVNVKFSGDDGIQLTEMGEGNIEGQLSNILVSDSAKTGIKAQMWVLEDEKEIIEPAGLLQINNVTLKANEKGDSIKARNIDLK